MLRRLIVLDFDDVVVERGFIFQKDAKYAISFLEKSFDLRIVTSRGLFSYLVAVIWLWLNRVDVPIEKSGPNGNKSKHCHGAYMFIDNDSKHVLNVLEGGNVEKVCLFSKNKKTNIETEKSFLVVSNWQEILVMAFSK